MSGATEISIGVENVSHRYSLRSSTVEALCDISFTVEAQRFVGLVGPSGCGKSSLLMMVAGLLQPSFGRIAVHGQTVVGPMPGTTGVVFQDPGLFPWRTARQNVEFPLEIQGMPARERAAVANRMLQLVGLGDFAGRYPHELSGGMKQRVAIARGLSQDPKVLLMDEPFSALDEQTRIAMGHELLHIWEKTNKSVLFVTHSLTEAVYLCDEVIVMSPRPGRILERLQIDLQRPRTYEMMASEMFGRLRDRIWQLIRTDVARS